MNLKKKTRLKDSIRSIPDFPKPGIIFYDITTLLQDKHAFGDAIDAIVRKYRRRKIDVVVAAEARGFILGGAVAHQLRAAFVPVRKKGKLPWKTRSVTYELEYGSDTLHMHDDAVKKGDRVLIVDDLLATGGTVKATAELIRKSGANVVGAVFLIELVDLKGRDKLKGCPVFSLIKLRGK
ncbi:MAG: adenine phosphoribosyltransferase [Candidatus Omnitrophota bacterium]